MFAPPFQTIACLVIHEEVCRQTIEVINIKFQLNNKNIRYCLTVRKPHVQLSFSGDIAGYSLFCLMTETLKTQRKTLK